MYKANYLFHFKLNNIKYSLEVDNAVEFYYLHFPDGKTHRGYCTSLIDSKDTYHSLKKKDPKLFDKVYDILVNAFEYRVSL